MQPLTHWLYLNPSANKCIHYWAYLVIQMVDLIPCVMPTEHALIYPPPPPRNDRPTNTPNVAGGLTQEFNRLLQLVLEVLL